MDNPCLANNPGTSVDRHLIRLKQENWLFVRRPFGQCPAASWEEKRSTTDMPCGEKHGPVAILTCPGAKIIG